MQLNPRQPSNQQRRGQHSRDRILASLQNQPDQSRDQLMQSANLTYDQVRDQTRNLCIEGLILSHIGTKGERRYSLRVAYRKSPRKTSA
jgi:predicted ArsR family transcriptional regulator